MLDLNPGQALSPDLEAAIAPPLLTPFEAAVLRATAAIPAGQVRTYGQIAAAVGRPGAARAVGQALAHNPAPVRIPCHRVVRADGHLGGYSGAGGREEKRALLAAEGADVQRLA
jgi:methylated-DNA-[protein]-cysteine S-methyltransferase